MEECNRVMIRFSSQSALFDRSLESNPLNLFFSISSWVIEFENYG